MKAMEWISAWDRACGLAIHTQSALATTKLGSTLVERIEDTALKAAERLARAYDVDDVVETAATVGEAINACADFRTQLYVADKIGIVDSTASNELIAESIEICGILKALRADLSRQREWSRNEPLP